MFPSTKQGPALWRPHSAGAVCLSAGDTVEHEQTLERVTTGRAQATVLAPSLIPELAISAQGIHTPDIKMLGRAREGHNGEQTALQDLSV